MYQILDKSGSTTTQKISYLLSLTKPMTQQKSPVHYSGTNN